MGRIIKMGGFRLFTNTYYHTWGITGYPGRLDRGLGAYLGLS